MKKSIFLFIQKPVKYHTFDIRKIYHFCIKTQILLTQELCKN